MKLFFVLLLLFFPVLVGAQELDTDGDGLSDNLELHRYYTNPNSSDTDGDGFDDNYELVNGFSPLQKDQRLIEVDTDHDGLSDGYELALKTDIQNRDSDGDGFLDGHEFANGYDPISTESKKLEKTIHLDLSEQRLWYQLGPVILNKFIISSGRPSLPTPTGEFKVQNKTKLAFSQRYGLYMPYWLGLGRGYGIHELPYWPSGYREGANHLGTPVSHGCVRLSPGAALELHDWAEVGTSVVIQD